MNEQLAESIFLCRPFQPGEPVLNRVLVMGGDQTGLELANRLGREGLEVLLVGNEAGAQVSESVKVMAGSVLEEVHGFVGRFEAVLRTAGERSRERVGFIVAAQPAEIVPKYDAYGLSKTPRVMALSDLESMQRFGDSVEPRRGDWFHAAFLLGLQGESEPTEFARVLKAIQRLQNEERVQCYVFTRNLKVAASGLERLYRESREQGTVFFKFDTDGSAFEDGPEEFLMTFKDPLLGLEMELAPDLLVVDERLNPPRSLGPLVDAIPSSRAASPFLKHDSTRFAGVETAKAGILAVGPSRGVFDAETIAGDIEAVVLAVKKHIPDSLNSALAGPPEIDPARCTICLTCVRLCPHGAISFHKRAEADPASCVRCGICAVECPMQAIRLEPPAGEEDLIERIRRGLSNTGEGAKRIVAFLCARSAAQALESVGMPIRRKITPIIVPCAGTIDPGHILAAMEEGAQAVLAAGCYKGNCASVYGTVLAAERTNQARHALQEAGIDPDLVMFASVAGNTPATLVQTIRHLEAAVDRAFAKNK
ncbi:MAG: hydrogenase iron-sulfur subunit [Desulfomonile tiedjei]|nr:hydrogenase iron-sulfur subunit [Desulfomonile tiedjei]